MGTIEGYPTIDDVIRGLESNKAKEVTLVPFMFVAGDMPRMTSQGTGKTNWKRKAIK